MIEEKTLRNFVERSKCIEKGFEREKELEEQLEVYEQKLSGQDEDAKCQRKCEEERKRRQEGEQHARIMKEKCDEMTGSHERQIETLEASRDREIEEKENRGEKGKNGNNG